MSNTLEQTSWTEQEWADREDEFRDSGSNNNNRNNPPEVFVKTGGGDDIDLQKSLEEMNHLRSVESEARPLGRLSIGIYREVDLDRVEVRYLSGVRLNPKEEAIMHAYEDLGFAWSDEDY